MYQNQKEIAKDLGFRIAFSPEKLTISFNSFSTHNTKFPIMFSILLSN